MDMMTQLKRVILLGLAGLIMPITMGAELYVSPTGNDTNTGTVSAPLQSLAAARHVVRAYVGKEAVTVHVADGIYYLPETLVFSPQD